MQLNSYKNYKDKWLTLVIWMIIAYCLMLFPLLWGNNKQMVQVEKYIPSTHNIKLLKSKQKEPLINALLDENWNCIWGIWCSKEERQPWDLNQAKDAQEMPVLTSTESHQRFIELCEKYNLPADVIWETENYYWLKEGTILCIAITETSWGKEWTYGRKGCYNYWNVGNTDDPNNRRCFANQWDWLAAIGQTLNNSLLRNNKTIACLHWAWNCIEPNASNKRYATSESGNRGRNMVGCFYSIYGELINQSTFNLHERV